MSELPDVKVVLRGRLEVPDRDLAAVMQALPDHVHLTRAEEGCIAFEVVQDPTTRNVFLVYEEFSSRHAFEAHQVRARNSRWGTLTLAAIRNYEITVENGC